MRVTEDNLSNLSSWLSPRCLLGQLALIEGLISEDQLGSSLEEQRKSAAPVRLGSILVARGLITSDQLAHLLKRQQAMEQEAGAQKETLVEETAAEESAERRRIGRYDLLEMLGEGGVGVVFRARDEELGREVALKMLKTAQSFSAVQIERFQREERNAARLSHPGIVRIYEVGQEGDALYYTMELVHGRPFNEAHFDLKERVRILEKVARAVHFAHEQGVIHRDLKPGNVLVDDRGEPHLLDFGLSRDVQTPSDLSRTGALLGTPYYMAPEQAEGRVHEVGPRSDVYALGVMLYEVLAGQVPFVGPTMPDIVRQLRTDDPKRPPGPADLVTLCLKAMEKEPSRRYPTAAAMADDLARTLTGEPIQARPPSLFYSIRRRLRRHAGKGAAAIAVLAVVSWFIWREVKSNQYHRAYQEGMELWSRRSAQEALWKFRLASEIYPARAEPWLMIGRCEQSLGRGNEAVRAWTEALARDPAYGPARFERGKYALGMYVRLRRPPPVSARPGQLRSGPVEPEDEVAKKWRREGESDLASARELELAEQKFLEGALAFGQGRFAEAAAALEAFAERNGADAPALALLGMASYYAGDMAAAERRLSEAILLEGRAAWFKARGDARYLRRKFEEALSDYIQADAPDARGLALQALDRLDEAIGEHAKAIERDPKSARAYNNRGMARALKRDFEGALADIERALLLHPTFAEAFNNRAFVNFLKRDFKEALVDFEVALSYDDKYADAYANRATVWKFQGEGEKAQADLRKALEVAPPDWPRRAEIERLLRE